MTDAPKKRGRPRKQPEPETKPAITEATTVDLTKPAPKPQEVARRTRDLIPPPPDAPAKSPEMMDWVFTYLPAQMASDFYGGITYIPRT